MSKIERYRSYSYYDSCEDLFLFSPTSALAPAPVATFSASALFSKSLSGGWSSPSSSSSSDSLPPDSSSSTVDELCLPALRTDRIASDLARAIGSCPAPVLAVKSAPKRTRVDTTSTLSFATARCSADLFPFVTLCDNNDLSFLVSSSIQSIIFCTSAFD